MSKPIKLQLNATLQRVAGQMEELTFHVTGNRKLKSGRYEHYEIELVACRFAVVKLLRGQDVIAWIRRLWLRRYYDALGRRKIGK